MLWVVTLFYSCSYVIVVVVFLVVFGGYVTVTLYSLLLMVT